jgi:hypothetical protein
MNTAGDWKKDIEHGLVSEITQHAKEMIEHEKAHT